VGYTHLPRCKGSISTGKCFRSLKGEFWIAFGGKAKKQIEFIKDLRRVRFDLVFDLRSDDRGAFMAFLSGAPIKASIVYHYIPWRNKLFTHLADPCPVDKTVCTAAEQSLRVVREFGIDSQDDVPKLWVSEKIHNRVKQLFDLMIIA
jgi:ADP-heptose:LPS heptosyltransferase